MRDGHRSDCKDCCCERTSRISKERRYAASRAFQVRHRERINEQAKRRRRLDPAKFVANTARCLRVTRWHVALASQCARRAKLKGFGCQVTPEFVLELHARQRGLCHWLGIPLVPSIEHRDPRRPSVDRLDQTRGYELDNVVLTCQFANMGRSNISAERFDTFVKELRQSMAAATAA